MTPSVLIANRGEIAVRVARAAADLGWRSVGVAATDDIDALHTRRVDEVVPLAGRGAAAYLAGDEIIGAALAAGCACVHPGYGFLAERDDFAAAVSDAGLVFVGPTAAMLRRLGDKGAAIDLASSLGIPTLPRAHTTDEARSVLAERGAVMVKAAAGGGGRGMRLVEEPSDLDTAWDECRREAERSFGDGAVYAEAYATNARHIEVQVIGDGRSVLHLGTRDCSVQRRRQKVIEVAPAALDAGTTAEICDAAVRLASTVDLDNTATVEFLVTDDGWSFLEVNPRIQVEHPVTEAVTGVDLVAAQLRLADGEDLAAIGLTQPPVPNGVAIEVRVSAERLGPGGVLEPTGGAITAFEAPSGPGVRVDTGVSSGDVASPAYDSLIAKVICHGPTFDRARRLVRRSLGEFRIDGLATTLPLTAAVLDDPEFGPYVTTTYLERRLPELVHHLPPPTERRGDRQPDATVPVAPAGTEAVAAPMLSTVVRVDVAVGDAVAASTPVAVLEAMKMEHVVAAGVRGIVRAIAVGSGDTLAEGAPLLFIEPAAVEVDDVAASQDVDLGHVRPDLEEVMTRHGYGLDEHRPEAVAKRHAHGHRTARENLADLVDDGSFIEYGSLVIAAQRRRRELQDLIERTPADGMIAGVGTVDGRPTAVLSYDYTVLAGTQGSLNHRKKDRMFEIIEQQRLPTVFYTEGGGGRPGDTDAPGVAGLDCLAFEYFARLSALVPLVGIVNGRCFAGNAALLGCCDVIIATRDSNVGMGGPAMIEGGGLGVFPPEAVGPVGDQWPNGVIDVLVDDEADATAVAKRYLAYFAGAADEWSCADQRRLRHLIPENRLRIYDVRTVIETLADTDSVLELRGGWGHGIVTALARVDGRPLGIVANNPAHLAGALDPDGCDKAARFIQLCDAHDLPILFLCDTPGFMVGPDVERDAMVRKAGRLFVTAANASVPIFTIVLRKGYGLGAQAMAGGSFHAPLFTISWPTGEFGGMGLEGAVRLGFRKELEAIDDPDERQATFQAMVDRMYEIGKGVNMAAHFEIDDVIDPAESRHWISATLRSVPPVPTRTGKKRPNIDAT